MKYTAITLGPIYDTFTQAKRTRSIWAASYFFSLFTREILNKSIDKEWEILLPYKKKIIKAKHGAGLYAERLYFINKSKSDIVPLINDVIKFFARDIAEYNKDKGLNMSSAEKFLRNYLNIHIVEITLSDAELEVIKNSKDEKEKSDNSVLKILNNLLDNKELNNICPFEFENNYLIDYFTTKWNEFTLLQLDAFSGNTDRKFKYIGEISTSDLSDIIDKDVYEELLRKDFRNEDIQLIDELKKITKKNKSGKDVSVIKDYHKYYAVLYADGDNIGLLLNSIANEDTKLQTFSKRLLDFGLKAEQSIVDYGGSPIYLGGEDILAFLPIASNDGKTLKSLALLIRNLDREFADTLGTYAKEQNVKIPTMSYGLMLAYYKFSMREAMQQAHDLLETSKNNIKPENYENNKQDIKLFPNKNGISVRFQKHSGQYMDCYIDKSKTESAKLIFGLLTSHLQSKDKKDTLSGLIQRLKDDVFFTTFIYAVRNDRIDAFFENFFNEDIHSKKITFTDYFKELATALKQDYLTEVSDSKVIEIQNQRFKDILSTVLRYYQFIQPSKND